MSTSNNVSSGSAARSWSAAKILNVSGLVAAASGMLIQMMAGSTLYPSLLGPMELGATALVVAFMPGRWPVYLGLLSPLILGIGAGAAAAMTGEFTQQLTDFGNPAIVIGSLLHIVGLVGAVVGAVWMLRLGGRPQG